MSGSSFSVCVHILTLLSHYPNEFLNSDFIAGSININPVMVRREMTKLKKAGLVESKEGKSGGNKIASPPSQITLKDILLAVKSDEEHVLSIYKNHPDHRCPIGAKIQEKLERLYADIDEQILAKLDTMTLKEFHHQFC